EAARESDIDGDHRRIRFLSSARAPFSRQNLGGNKLMVRFEQYSLPTEGERITIDANGKLNVPNNPIIPFIEGDGTGPDIWNASKRILDAAVEIAYKGEKKIAWYEVFAGEKAFNTYNSWLPADTLTAIREYIVAI